MKSIRLLASFLGAGLLVQGAHGSADYSGRYLLVQKTVSTTKLPVIKDVVAATTAIGFVDLEQSGQVVSGTGQLCELRLDSTSNMVKTTFPPAFVRALPPLGLDAQIERRGGKPYLVSEAKTLVLGAKLKNPRTDPLPDDAKAPSVYDQDGDGHPGMTVEVSGLVSGEVYVVQRSTTQLSGRRIKNGFAGGIHFELEQNVIGASKSMLRHGPEPRADSSKSNFVLLQLSDHADCAEAKRLAGRIQ